jgi:hypothetical protein
MAMDLSYSTICIRLAKPSPARQDPAMIERTATAALTLLELGCLATLLLAIALCAA